MCCRTMVKPIPPEPTLSLIMHVAGFAKQGEQHWRRDHAEGYIDAYAGGEGMHLSLYPSIQTHSPEEHEANAGRAAILFKVAMTLAEMSDGTVEQRSLVGECSTEAREAGLLNTMASIVLANYPGSPLVFENLCMGFRRVLNKGVGQEEVRDAGPA